MMNLFTRKKEHPELPDSYGAKVHLETGEVLELDLVSCFVDRNRWFVYCTADDEWVWIPSEKIKRVTFDKKWSKIIAIRTAMKEKRQENPPHA